MKEVTKNGLKSLVDREIIKNTVKGYVNKRGDKVTVYITCSGKIYTEDKYADMTR